MAVREFARPVRRELLDELAAAGFSPTVAGGAPRLRFLPDRCWVECEDAELAAVAAVVAAHNPAAIDAAVAREEAQDADRRQRLRQVVAALEAGTLTLAQTEAALARLIRVLARRGVL